jgi:hypothetical protein
MGTGDEEQVLGNFSVSPEVPFPTILLVGKRFTGKSTTAVALAGMFGYVERWAAWCGTKETEDYWADRFGSSACVWGPDEVGVKALRRIVAYQQKKVRLYGKCLKEPLPSKYMVGMIFDDVTSCRLFRRGELLEDLFSNGRHYKAVIVISCQYPKQLPPAVRTNTDYIIMMHNTKRTCQILFEEFVENPGNVEAFTQLLQNATSQTSKGKPLYNALVYNNCIKTTRLDEMFSIFRHTPGFRVEGVQLGSEAWQSYNRECYRDAEETAVKREHNRRERMKKLAQVRSAGANYLGCIQPEADVAEEDSGSSSDNMCRLRDGRAAFAATTLVRIPHGYRELPPIG